MRLYTALFSTPIGITLTTYNSICYLKYVKKSIPNVVNFFHFEWKVYILTTCWADSLFWQFMDIKLNFTRSGNISDCSLFHILISYFVLISKNPIFGILDSFLGIVGLFYQKSWNILNDNLYNSSEFKYLNKHRIY